jgi:hypothetical protein
MTAAERAVVRHEAGHAAAGLLLGLGVRRVERDDDGGITRIPLGWVDADRARAWIKTLMCGPLTEPADIPAWPPSRHADTYDERLLAAFADYLKLTRVGWFGLYGEAVMLTRRRDFDLLWRAIDGLFERHAVLDRDALAVAVRIALKVARVERFSC